MQDPYCSHPGMVAGEWAECHTQKDKPDRSNVSIGDWLPSQQRPRAICPRQLGLWLRGSTIPKLV